jgi:hypothetical protein
VYDLKAIWVKNNGRNVLTSIRSGVLAITDSLEEAPVQDEEVKIASYVESFGRDGMTAYETAVMRGINGGITSEVEWIGQETARQAAEAEREATFAKKEVERDVSFADSEAERQRRFEEYEGKRQQVFEENEEKRWESILELEDCATKEYVDEKASRNEQQIIQNRDVINSLATDVDEHDKKLDILYKVELSFKGGGNMKKGTSVSVNLTWTVKVNGTYVNPSSQKLNGETLANDRRSKTFTGVTTDTTYTLVVDGVTATKYVKFYNHAYFGIVDPSYTVGNNTAGLTELSNYGSRGYTTNIISSSGSKKAVPLLPAGKNDREIPSPVR